MDIVHPRVAGIGVHEKMIWVAVRVPGGAPGQRTVMVGKFATFWRPLQKMARWLAELGVSDVAREGTGICWWPVYHALASAGCGDMSRFASAARLAAWAGLAPGDNQSAGKRKHAAARQGNQHLRAAMVEAAWATRRTATRPGARFRRLARRFGKGHEKKAAVAVAHTLLNIAWAVMRYDAGYIDAGTDYYDRRDQRNREHLIRYHEHALARLGVHVTTSLPGDGSPPPAPHPPPGSSPAQAA